MKRGDRVYFAHSLREYDTPAERNQMRELRGMGLRPCNPNGKLPADNWFNVAADFIRVLDALVFTTYRGHVGRGVFEEVLYACNCGKPVYWLSDQELIPIQSFQLEVVSGGRDWVFYAKVEVQ